MIGGTIPSTICLPPLRPIAAWRTLLVDSLQTECRENESRPACVSVFRNYETGTEKARVFRKVNKGDRLTGKFIADEKAIWRVVVHYARATSLGKLAPHDLRRYAESGTMPNRLG